MLLALLLACAPTVTGDAPPGDAPPGGDPPGDDLTDAVYDIDHLMQVDIVLDPGDWDDLRFQTRDAWDVLTREDCQAEPFGSPFTWFEAAVTIDGEHLEPVAVRKKGFLGSLSEDRPALKLDLAEYDGDLRYSGVKRLTLNNAISDPALVRQCVGYGIFRDAGVPAPRCSFARVTVNGQDLGIYANVEPIKSQLLGRWFDDPSGDLYEGTLSDFREGWTVTFEKKSNASSDDWSDIDAVVEAVAAPDDELLDALSATIDLDAYLTFWATEVLVTHGDGYAGNTNNFYLYADPGAGLLHFLPWGIDEAIQPDTGYPASVMANAVLPRRLYLHPDGRDLYLDRLMHLLDVAWDEDVLDVRIDGMESLLLPEVDDPDALSDQIAVVREALAGRREAITDEVERGGVEWDQDLRDSYCITFIGEATVGFETWWGSVDSEDPFSAGAIDVDITWNDEHLDVISGGSVAGWSGAEAIVMSAAWISDTEAIVAWFAGPESSFVPGTVEVGMDTDVAALFYIDTATMDDFEFVAYILGEVELEQAGTDDGDPLVGTISGELMSWGR